LRLAEAVHAQALVHILHHVAEGDVQGHAVVAGFAHDDVHIAHGGDAQVALHHLIRVLGRCAKQRVKHPPARGGIGHGAQQQRQQRRENR